MTGENGLGPFGGTIFRENVSVFDGMVVKYLRLEIHPRGSGWLRLAPAGSAETGQEVRPGTSLPRAGGQDDVSFNKLPQKIPSLLSADAGIYGILIVV